MSARARLALSYLAFLVVAAALFAGLLYYLLRFVPDSGDGTYGPTRSALLEAVLPRAGQVLAVLVVVAAVGGWVLAGRMLRPLQRLSTVAGRVAEGEYGHRVHPAGPDDEFHRLGVVFDTMLDRTQATFEEQRRFAANASHELRTPAAVSRSLIEVALADPDGHDLPQVLHRLGEINRRSIEALEALLTLSTLDHGAGAVHTPIDLPEVLAGVLVDVRPVADAAGVTIRSALGEGDVDGDPVLVRQMLTNLVLNAVRHNLPADGWVHVEVSAAEAGEAAVTVVNSGPVVAADVLPRLTEPFVRGAGRTAEPDATGQRGAGLGLAIVARVAQVHGARLALHARPEGGLRVVLAFAPPHALGGDREAERDAAHDQVAGGAPA